tara:strand:+ start:135 stop:485 length:351 start_codon:yes stop_codon:yes gene_type:complete
VHTFQKINKEKGDIMSKENKSVLEIVGNVPEMEQGKNYFANRFNPTSGKYDTKVVENMELVGDIVYAYVNSESASKYLSSLMTRFAFVGKRVTDSNGKALVDKDGDRYITITLGAK